MAGEEAFNKMVSSTGGFGMSTSSTASTSNTGTGYIGKVYLGSTPVVKGKKVMSPTGTEYTELDTGGETVKSIIDVQNSFYTWDDRTLNNFMTRLKKYGYNDVTLPKAKSIWDMAVEGASSWLAGSNGARKVTPDQYIEWYSKGSGEAAPKPTKNIYQYDPIVLGGLIDSIYQKTLGKLPTAEEKSARLKELQVEINKGTVTKTTRDKSGMAVTTTTPGFTQEEAQLSIAEKLKQENPDDYDRQKRIDFSSWLSQNVQGA
jgi:hypothetical protein